jgi:N-acetylglucosamine-6-phosphate deacetylase
VTAFSHLYNAMPALHHREGGCVCVALLGEGFGEIIADGLHICPDMVALAYRCLGNEKAVLITDSMEATGCPDGEYSIAGQPVIVKNGKAVTLDGALAGSTLDLWNGVKNLMAFAGASFADAVLCATRNPAKMLGVEDSIGTLEVGKRADLLLVDEADMAIKTIYAKGEQVI